MFTTGSDLDSSAIVDTWERLAREDLGPFVRPEWASVWRKHFGDRSKLVVVTASDGSEAAPWGVWTMELLPGGVLEQLGGQEVTDYSAPAVREGRIEDFALELADYIVSGGPSWKRLHFEAIPADLGFHRPFVDELSAQRVDVTISFEEVCPVIDLPDSFSEYLGTVGKKHRHEIRRKLRKFESEVGQPVVATATPQTLEEDLDQFFFWHRNSKGPKGGFLDSGYENFFRDIARIGIEKGWLRLTFLEAGSRRYSSCFGFELGKNYFLYNSAHDPEARELSPGIIHIVKLIESGIERGLDRFDFLQGSERYKMELGAVVRRLVTIDASR
jgi:CelD/BcsL family acetyltransferase involved in cellulose biosynthesis